MSARILIGDACQKLATLPSASVHCICTSPPYWGLRDYKADKSTHGDGSQTRARDDTEHQAAGMPRLNLETATLGWRPTCDCAADTVPTTILDPFSGAGTTAMVAAQMGRNAIGIELNPAYAEMARKRIEKEAGTLFTGQLAAEQAT